MRSLNLLAAASSVAIAMAASSVYAQRLNPSSTPVTSGPRPQPRPQPAVAQQPPARQPSGAPQAAAGQSRQVQAKPTQQRRTAARQVRPAADRQASAQPKDLGKDWFGLPRKSCEPKCYWYHWIGRKDPREEGSATARAAPAVEPAVPAVASANPAPKSPSTKVAQRTSRRDRPWVRVSPPDVGWSTAALSSPSDEPDLIDGVAERVSAAFSGYLSLIVRPDVSWAGQIRDGTVAVAPSAGSPEAVRKAIEEAGGPSAVKEVAETDEDGIARVRSGNLDGLAVGTFGGVVRFANRSELRVISLERPAELKTAPYAVFANLGPSDLPPFETVAQPAPEPVPFPASADGAGSARAEADLTRNRKVEMAWAAVDMR